MRVADWSVSLCETALFVNLYGGKRGRWIIETTYRNGIRIFHLS